jgi:hypothetical protein
MEPISVATSFSTSDSIDRARASSGVIESTTPGVFAVPEGETQYSTFLEMMRAQAPKPDVAPYVPDEEEFEKLKKMMSGLDIHSKTGVIAKIDELMAEGMSFDNAFNIAQREQVNPVDLMSMAIREDAGFPLDKMEENEAEFKKMYDDMFSRTGELGKMGAGDFEARLAVLKTEILTTKSAHENTYAYQCRLDEGYKRKNMVQNGLSKMNSVEGNGSDSLNVSSGRSPVHEAQRPSTPLYYHEPDTTAGIVVPTAEEGSA